MMDLAYHTDLPHVHRRDIAKRHGIPTNYLDQIMLRLRLRELVLSIRGRGGGYRLAKDPETITMWDIFSAVEDSIYPVECVDEQHTCDYSLACVSRSAWEEILRTVRKGLESLNLKQLVQNGSKMEHVCPAGIVECRTGRPTYRPSHDEKEMTHAGEGGKHG